MSRKRSVLPVVFGVIFVALTTFATGVVGWVWYDIKEDRYTDLSNTAAILERYYELTFRHRELSLLSVGLRLLEIEGEDYKAKRLQFANEALEIYDELLAIGFVDTTGQIITLTGSSPEDTLPNLVQRPETRRSFLEAKKSEGVTIGESYYFDVVDDWIIPIRVPIRDRSGKLLAVNTSAIAYQKLLDNLNSFQFNPRYRIQLISGEYNTTQLYFPLSKDLYGQVLHHPADFYENRKSQQDRLDRKRFEARNRLEGYRCLAIETLPNSLNQYLIVSVDQAILWDEFSTTFWIIVIAYLFLSAVTWIAFNHSVRKERQHVKAINQERNYSENIIETSPTLIVGLDSEGKCVFINAAAQRVLNIEKSKIVGKGWWNEITLESEREVLKEQLRAIENKEIDRLEGNFITRSGNQKVILWRNNYFDSSDKSQVIWFGVDITEQKQAEKELRRREANLKSLFESTNSIIGLFDREKRLIEFNQSFAKYAKQSDNLDIYKGMDVLSELDPAIANIFKDFQDRALAGEKFKETLEYPFPEGNVHFLFNYNPIYNDGEVVGISMFVEDITELKNSQTELQKYARTLEDLVEERTEKLKATNSELSASNKDLQQAILELKNAQDQLIQAEKMASLGLLAAGIGHEINNPLNFIKNGLVGLEAALVQSEKDQKPAGVKTFVKIIKEGVDRASKIVKGLSHFSRSGISLSEYCNIHDIIDNCLVILQSEFKGRIQVVKNFEGEDLIIKGSEGKLHQAFLNILSNAHQAIVGSGTIEITTKLLEDAVEVSFYDSGIGIPKEHLSRIKDLFFTTKAPGKGTGLGLSITYNIIKEHGGGVEVKSEVNEGTLFKISLPHPVLETKAT